MDWLFTIHSSLSLEHLDDLLAEWGGERTTDVTIPLSDDERVIEVTGPKDLPQKAKSDERVLKVSPNSQMDYF